MLNIQSTPYYTISHSMQSKSSQDFDDCQQEELYEGEDVVSSEETNAKEIFERTGYSIYSASPSGPRSLPLENLTQYLIPNCNHEQLYSDLFQCLSDDSSLNHNEKKEICEKIYRYLYKQYSVRQELPEELCPFYFRLLHFYAKEFCFGQMIGSDQELGFKQTIYLMEMSLKQQLDFLENKKFELTISTLNKLGNYEPQHLIKKLLKSTTSYEILKNIDRKILNKDQALIMRLVYGDTVALLSLSYQNMQDPLENEVHLKVYDHVKNIFTYSYKMSPICSVFMQKKCEFSLSSNSFITHISHKENEWREREMSKYKELAHIYCSKESETYQEDERHFKITQIIFLKALLQKRKCSIRKESDFLQKAFSKLDSQEVKRPKGWKTGWEYDFLQGRIYSLLAKKLIEEGEYDEATSHVEFVKSFMQASLADGAHPIEFETEFRPVIDQFNQTV